MFPSTFFSAVSVHLVRLLSSLRRDPIYNVGSSTKELLSLSVGFPDCM